ncbi:pyroglutamylated RF-amide peptide receptor-like [Branchiostoma lanceolatum]|uniref:pyroglutamylated RF-amide peptide receptor-like n=1 Tax=Branchiostoma lanceolatum TaxID=7740 RepID=UPI0034527383
MSPQAALNMSLLEVFTNVTNATETFFGDLLYKFVTSHLNITYGLAQKITNATNVTSFTKATENGTLCDIVITNVTAGNVTTTVASYDPAACGIYGSYPAIQPLLIIILLCYTTWSIFGNGCLGVVIATNKDMREPGNMFLCALALTDVALSLSYTPIAIHSLVQGEHPGGLSCRIQAFFMSFLTVLSIYLQVCLWICRYVHIAHPYKFESMLTRGRLAGAMAGCFLIALAPPVVGLARVGTVYTWSMSVASVDIAEPISLMMPCTPGGPESAAVAVLCLLGVAISCGFACLIGKVAWDSETKHDQQLAWQAQADKLKKKLRAAKTLGIVVAVQWLTWVPLMVGAILTKVNVFTTDTASVSADICFLIMQISTFSDSIVYAFRNEIYRKGVATVRRKIRNAVHDIRLEVEEYEMN